MVGVMVVVNYPVGEYALDRARALASSLVRTRLGYLRFESSRCRPATARMQGKGYPDRRLPLGLLFRLDG